ncbi:MAG: site-2 protease family protein [Leptolyngbyaceae bacterium]|nr:site-2 protease family protein [Leptolyngbyaceae bacterium]
MVTLLLLVGVIGILVWGFRRAQPYGKMGVFAWLQSVVLVFPWVLFLGLAATGIFLNFAVILMLIVGSAVLYVVLGNKLRAESQDAVSQQKSEFRSEFRADPSASGSPSGASPSGENETSSQSSYAKSADRPKAVHPFTESSQGGDRPTDPPPASSTNRQNESESSSTATQRIDPADLERIKGIFGIDTFYSTDAVPYQDGAAFKGNLRGEPEQVHQKLSALLHERLGDRYSLYLLEGPDGKPVVIVLPSTNVPEPTTPFQFVVSIVLAIATFITCLETAGILQGFNIFTDSERIPDSLWIAIGIMSILFAHELGHWIKAKEYQVKLSPPFLIPALQIGSFGSLTRFETVLSNRTVLFDIAIAGPIFGGVLSLVFLIIGLLLSHQGSFFQIPTSLLQGSVLVGVISRIILGSQLQQPIVDIHPLMIVGWLGLVITALNTLPAGQLDGGRIVQAIYGRTIARRMTIATVILLGIITLVQPLALYWAIIILFLQRSLERPSLNEMTEPNDARAALGLLALFMAAAILLPLTPGLSSQLGIGG